MGGKRGHVAMFDWKNGNLGCELHLNETVRDIKYGADVHGAWRAGLGKRGSLTPCRRAHLT
jgi:hypothetical protein